MSAGFRAGQSNDGYLQINGTDILTVSSGVLGVKNTGAQSEVRLYCESNNAHYASIKSPPHSDFIDNVTFTLPGTSGSSGQVLQTDGSGNLSWVTQSGGGGGGGVSDKMSEGNTEAEVVDTGSDGHFKVTTEGVERLRIDSDGHVKSRVANLAVSNDSATFQVLTTESQAADFGGTLGLGGVYHATNQLSFANIAGKKENSTTGNSLGYLAIATRGGSGMAERLRITSDGKFGLNTIDPQTELHVKGIDGYAELRLEGTSTGGGTIEFYNQTTKVADIFADNSNNIVFRNTTERLRIGSSGQIGIAGANYGTSGQVLTSGGASGAVSWTTISGGGGSYGNSDVDNHLNSGAASTGQILSWNGSDYAWVADQTGGGGGGLSDLVDDTTPQLGGNLSLNSNNITGTGDINITGTLTSDGVSVGDDDKIKLGTGNDLQIYHDGSHSYISESSGTGDLRLVSSRTLIRDENDSNHCIIANSGGSVDLYHNGNAKLATTSTGVTVTGTLAATAVTGDGSGLTSIAATTLGGQTGSYYTGYTDTAIANLVDSSPGTLNTLNELAAALGDDANFSTTVTTSIAAKLPLAGGTMTGALNMGSNNITTTGKVLFANVYSALGDLPSASTYHGMFAHVHGTGKGYFAHGGNWVQLLDTNNESSFLKSDANDTFSGDLTGASGANILLNSNIGNSGSTAFASMTGRLEFDQDFSDTARGPNKILLYSDGTTWISGFAVHNDTTAYYSGGTHKWYKSNSSTSFTEVANLTSSGSLSTSSQGTLWGASNDGAGSGLDADTLDGNHASRFVSGTGTIGTNEGTVNNWNSPTKSGWYSHSNASNRWTTTNWSSIMHVRLYDSNNNYATQLGFDTYDNNLYTRTNNNSTWSSWAKIWHEGNDGASSGLDADTLDGIQSTGFVSSTADDVMTGKLTLTPSGFVSGIANHACINISSSGTGETRAIDIDGGWTSGENKSISFTHGTASTNFIGQINCNYVSPAGEIRFGKLYYSGDSSAYVLDLKATSTSTADLMLSGRMVVGGNRNYSDNPYNSVSSTRLLFASADSNAISNYYIGTNMENYGGNYTKLDIAWHTGIRIGAQQQYGGTRIYNNEDFGTVLFSVGTGNANVAVTNNLTAGGNVTAYSSDKRLKENFKNIESPLEKISKLNGCNFDWIENIEELGFTPEFAKNDVGLIAQEVESVCPQAVAPAPFDQEYDANAEDPKDRVYKSKSGEDYLTVKYEKLIPLLVESIKELKSEIDELREKLEEK